MLLEKAFAKFVGSFGALDGGSTAWALNALTGDPVFELRKSKGDDGSSTWERIDMRAKHDERTNERWNLSGAHRRSGTRACGRSCCCVAMRAKRL